MSAQILKLWKSLASTYLSTSISSAVYLWPWDSLACTALIVCGLSFKEKSGPNGKNVLTGWFGLAAFDFSFWDDFDIDTFSASALKQIKTHSIYNLNKNKVMFQSFISLFMLPYLLNGMNKCSNWPIPPFLWKINSQITSIEDSCFRKRSVLMPVLLYFPILE